MSTTSSCISNPIKYLPFVFASNKIGIIPALLKLEEPLIIYKEQGVYHDEIYSIYGYFISSPYDFFSIPQNSQQASMSEEVFRKKPLGRRRHLMSCFAKGNSDCFKAERTVLYGSST